MPRPAGKGRTGRQQGLQQELEQESKQESKQEQWRKARPLLRRQEWRQG